MVRSEKQRRHLEKLARSRKGKPQPKISKLKKELYAKHPEKNPKWKDGNWKRLNDFRENSTICLCEKCGKHKKLDIHHKDKNRLNNDRDNLIFLCRRCHKLIHFRGDDYFLV